MAIDSNFHIRWMIRRDMPCVLEIEQLNFGVIDGWREQDFVSHLRQRNCIGMVIEEDEIIVGFMVYELFKNRLQIINIAVHPDHHRKGICTEMIQKLQNKLSYQGRRKLEIMVSDAFLPMHLALRKSGFRCVKVKRREFGEDDGYVFRYEVNKNAKV